MKYNSARGYLVDQVCVCVRERKGEGEREPVVPGGGGK